MNGTRARRLADVLYLDTIRVTVAGARLNHTPKNVTSDLPPIDEIPPHISHDALDAVGVTGSWRVVPRHVIRAERDELRNMRRESPRFEPQDRVQELAARFRRLSDAAYARWRRLDGYHRITDVCKTTDQPRLVSRSSVDYDRHSDQWWKRYNVRGRGCADPECPACALAEAITLRKRSERIGMCGTDAYVTIEREQLTFDPSSGYRRASAESREHIRFKLCGDLYCPRCAIHRVKQLWKTYAPALKTARWFVTFTQHQAESETAAQSVARMRKSVRKWINSKRQLTLAGRTLPIAAWFESGMLAFETTDGRRGMPHAHCHALVSGLPGRLSKPDLVALRRAYIAVTGNEVLHFRRVDSHRGLYEAIKYPLDVPDVSDAVLSSTASSRIRWVGLFGGCYGIRITKAKRSYRKTEIVLFSVDETIRPYTFGTRALLSWRGYVRAQWFADCLASRRALGLKPA